MVHSYIEGTSYKNISTLMYSHCIVTSMDTVVSMRSNVVEVVAVLLTFTADMSEHVNVLLTFSADSHLPRRNFRLMYRWYLFNR